MRTGRVELSSDLKSVKTEWEKKERKNNSEKEISHGNGELAEGNKDGLKKWPTWSCSLRCSVQEEWWENCFLGQQLSFAH